MGQKVNPIGIRLGITRDWNSKWFANTRSFPGYVLQDWQVREFLKKKLAEASVSRIYIERAARKANITIQTARPGVVIGKKGEDIERLRLEVAKMMGMPVSDVRINISEIRKPEIDAQLVAEGIAQQIERRVMFRRAMKRAVMNTMRSGALGVKVRVSGRLNGSEIARTEWYREGRIPLHTFRCRNRLRTRGVAHHLWRNRRQGVDLQGRGLPAGNGAGRAGRGSAARRGAGHLRPRGPVPETLP
jgi:small subunit ribosomal protein S3